jgi:5'-3' exonuclease
MTQKYILVDLMNTYFRMRHVASKQSDSWTKVGYALHLIFASVNKVVRKFGPDCHVVFCLDGHSWRKGFYAPYKANRDVRNQDLSDAEREESEMFWETYTALTNYLTEKTNCSVLREENSEADDIIARFIHLHPDDEHFIISSDTDFYQLISKNVKQYNGINDELVTLEGFLDHKFNPIVDKKTKTPKEFGDPQFILFEKIMRGDSTDNIFSAYPGVRSKGSKKKVGLIEAYADRDKQGWNWNNMMLQAWLDHLGVEHRVRDDYLRNKTLVDLTCQPQNIKDECDLAISKGVRTAHVLNVGLHFLKFTGKYELKRISDQPDQYISWLNREYRGILREAC